MALLLSCNGEGTAQANNARPDQAVYERLIAEQEKTAKRVKMTNEQFKEECFIPNVAPILKKRNDVFLKANNVYVFDEDADVEAEFKKLFEYLNKNF